VTRWDGPLRWWRDAVAWCVAWRTRPRVGQWIYIPSSLYLSHGLDDIAGGRARILKVKFEYGKYWVEVEQDPGTQYSWPSLLEEQPKLREQYGDEIAHPDPDSRPEFNRD
jgi:hypothetical protein